MKVLVSDNLSSVGVEILKKESGIEVDVKTGMTKEELIQVIPDYDGLAIRSATKVTADVIEAATKLKVIGRAGIGVDNVDLNAAGKKGIIVMNAPDGNVITTAEHAMALMLSLSRNTPQANQSVKVDGQWTPKKYLGVELFGKTLGVVGMGRIGSIVAQRAKGFAMKILAYDPYITDEHAESLGVERAELKDVLERSDFLTLHTPKISGKPLLGKEEFDCVKPGIRIVNCARGGLIDEEALAQAIQDKKVAGAALDVYSQEPVNQDNPLLKLDEVICTPHLGASTEEAQENVAVAIADQMIDYLKYGRVRNAVNMPSIDEDLLGQIKPHLELGEKLGTLISQLTDDGLESLQIIYCGEVAELKVEPITISVLKGFFSGSIEGVNMVNAPYLAKERGISIKESKNSDAKDYANTMEVVVRTKSGSRSITGTIFGNRDPRIAKLDDFNLEARFSDYMLVLKNKDAPGVIGHVGKVLEKNKINIAGFHLGRFQEKGTAVSIINVDSPPTNETLRELRETPNITEVHSVKL